jgi:CBS domain-containing protein
MFTEKLLIRLLAHRPEAVDEPVAEHQSVRIVCLRGEEPIARLITTMQKHALRWVCMVDGDGRPTALADLRGVIEYVADHVPRIVKVQPIEPKLSMEQREGA